MKKFIPYLFLIFLAGLAIPYFYGLFPKAFVYLTGILFLIVLILFFKKGRITVYDWLIIYMALIPLHSFRIGSESLFLRLTEVAFVPFAFFWIVNRKTLGGSQEVRFFKKEYLILIVFILFSFMSITRSINPYVSIYRTVILIYLMVFSFIVADIFRDTKKIVSIIKAMIFISSLVGLIAICQSFFPVLYPFFNRGIGQIGGWKIIRAGAGWHDPNYCALYLTMIIPVTISCLFSRQFIDVKYLKWCLVLQVGGLVSTYSRSSFVGFLTAFFFLMWIYGKKILSLALIIVFMLSVLGLTLTIDYWYEHVPYIAGAVFRIVDKDVLEETPTLVAGSRWDAWRANMAMFLDNPILGVGPFVSTDLYLKYRPADDVWLNNQPIAVHSEYLSLLSERGILGFITFAMFLIVLLRRSAKAIAARLYTKTGALIAGLMAGIISFMIFSIPETSLYSIQFWLSVGLIIALLDIVKKEGAEGAISLECK